MTYSTRGNKWRVYLEIDGVLLTGQAVSWEQCVRAEEQSDMGVIGWDWNNPGCRLDLTVSYQKARCLRTGLAFSKNC